MQLIGGGGVAADTRTLPDPLAGRKIELCRIDSREVVERLQPAFADARLIFGIAQFRSVVDFRAGTEQPSQSQRRNTGEAADVATAVFDKQQAGTGIVVKRLYTARLDQEGLHAHTHTER